MIRYEFRNLDEDTVHQLIELSRCWVEEECCWGMIPNEREDLQEPLAVALDGDRIAGYAFGHFYTQEKRTSYIEPGCRCFAVDELYVLPQYRSMGIGRALFQMIEREAAKNSSFLTLTTSTKNYKSILELYIEELGMNFHSAFLIKNLEETLCE